MRVDEVQDTAIDSDERVLGEDILGDAAESPGTEPYQYETYSEVKSVSSTWGHTPPEPWSCFAPQGTTLVVGYLTPAHQLHRRDTGDQPYAPCGEAGYHVTEVV